MAKKWKRWQHGSLSSAEVKRILLLASKGQSALEMSKEINRPAYLIRGVLEREKKKVRG